MLTNTALQGELCYPHCTLCNTAHMHTHFGLAADWSAANIQALDTSTLPSG